MLNVLEGQEVIDMIAPGYEVDERLIRFGLRKPPVGKKAADHRKKISQHFSRSKAGRGVEAVR